MVTTCTYLLFLNMADERGIANPSTPERPTLLDHTGAELTDERVDILRQLGNAPGLSGDICAGVGEVWHARNQSFLRHSHCNVLQ